MNETPSTATDPLATCRRARCLISASLCGPTGYCTACALIERVSAQEVAAVRRNLRTGVVVRIADGGLARVTAIAGDNVEVQRPDCASSEQCAIAELRIAAPSDRTRYATQLWAANLKLN